MYWYVKYPLIALLVLALFGLGSSVFRSCRKNAPDKEKQIQIDSDENAEPGQDSGASGGMGIFGQKKRGKQSQKDDMTEMPSGLETTRSVPKLKADDAVRVETQLKTARKQLDSGSLVAARRLAQLVLATPGVIEFDPVWERAVAVINDVNKRIMNSTAPSPEKKRYCVTSGDTLRRIAGNHFISMRSLFRINECLHRNGKENPVITPSMTLMYIDGTWSIRVSKTHFTLQLFLNDQLYRCYKVGIGKEDRTPLGYFLITSQTMNPDWTPPGRAPVPFGDPENVLGTRWLKLTPDASKGTDVSLEGYGIHGTPEPETIGTSSSMGCIRMRNEEVEELYDFIPIAGGSTPPVQVLIED